MTLRRSKKVADRRSGALRLTLSTECPPPVDRKSCALSSNLPSRTNVTNYTVTAVDWTHCRYIMEHFTDIATKSNELLMLSDEAMVEIISSDDLNVKNEEIVFESIIRWINHDPNNRRQHIAKLLRCIRLGLLSTQYFVETVKVQRVTLY